jgi:predicted alpha/beta hydrolase
MRHQEHAAVPLRFGEGGRLFGWLHPAHGGAARAGVVLLNPLGDDDVRAHRPLRKLAARLAARGFAVMRFDFHGTGDSAGSEHEPGRVRRWLSDVGAAIDELAARARTRSVVLAGLRLGATLGAVAASERGDVDGVLLWEPFRSGRAFVDEMVKLHRVHRALEPQGFAGGPAERREGVEALGFFLTRDTVAGLAEIDLAHLARRPAARVAVCSAMPEGATLDLAARLGALGAEIRVRRVPSAKFLASVPHETTLPEALFDGLVEAIEGLAPAEPPRPLEGREAGELAPARADDVTEEPLSFGDGGSLFGMLARPPAHAAGDRPAVLLINAGTVHRVGPHRLYVPMARRWARLGFPVLRMDLSGVGDSATAAGNEENLCYPRGAARDVAAGIAMLAARTGARSFVLAGLCSGADHAFRGALVEPRASGVVILNPRTFGVRTEAEIKAHAQARHVERALSRKESFAKLARGEVDVGRVARAALPRLAALARARVAALVTPRHVRDAPSDVPAALRRLAERGVFTLVVGAEGDPGLDYVDTHFAPGMRALARLPGFLRATVRGADHTFTSLWSQRRVADLVTEHLTRRYLAPTT